MPGGRLTHRDRQHIASGLAEGLGYAEIGRRLGRPTSTISREVARNGGYRGYRAEAAQEATGRRAGRRRRPTAPPLAVPDEYGRDPEAVRAFAEQFAALIVQTGLPRMAARVLAVLFTTDSASLTAAELVQQLRVSPASVSKAIGYLEGLAMVRRERDPRRRRERYVIEDDVWFGAWSASARKTAMWADTAKQGADILEINTPAGARLDQMSRFFGRLSDDMAGGPAAMAADDALTVLAALVLAGAPLTADDLAAALDWPPDRVMDALHNAERHPEITDPVALSFTTPGTYTVTAGPGRLSAAQREALCGQPRPAGPPHQGGGPARSGIG